MRAWLTYSQGSHLHGVEVTGWGSQTVAITELLLSQVRSLPTGASSDEEYREILAAAKEARSRAIEVEPGKNVNQMSVNEISRQSNHLQVRKGLNVAYRRLEPTYLDAFHGSMSAARTCSMSSNSANPRVQSRGIPRSPQYAPANCPHTAPVVLSEIVETL